MYLFGGFKGHCAVSRRMGLLFEMVSMKKKFISSKYKPKSREELWLSSTASNHSRREHSRGMFKEPECWWLKSTTPQESCSAS